VLLGVAVWWCRLQRWSHAAALLSGLGDARTRLFWLSVLHQLVGVLVSDFWLDTHSFLAVCAECLLSVVVTGRHADGDEPISVSTAMIFLHVRFSG